MKQAQRAVGAVLALALTLVLVPSTPAAPLEAENVPADAKWLMHLDVDSFRDTKLAEFIRQNRLDDPNVQRWLGWVEGRYGIDLRKDLHGVTLYGVNYEPHRGVILLFGDYDTEKTVAVLKDEPGYKTSTYGDYTIHSWAIEHHKHAHQEGKGYPDRMAAAFHDKGVVIAASGDGVRHALDTLVGKDPALKDSSPLLGDRPQGTVFYGAAIELENLKKREEHLPQFAVLQQGKYVNLALGQHEGTAFYRVRFEARSPEVAEQIGKILEGFEAMLELQGERDETVANVAQGFKWDVDDTTVKLNWKAKSDDVVKLVRQRLDRMPLRQALREGPEQHEKEAPQQRR